MRKSVFVILGVIVVLFGGGYYLLTQYQKTASSPPNITVVGDQTAKGLAEKKQPAADSKGTVVSPSTGTTSPPSGTADVKSKSPGSIIFPESSESAVAKNDTINPTNPSNPSTGSQSTNTVASSDNGGTTSNNSSGSGNTSQTSAPIASAPTNTSPPPPSPQPSSGLIYTESLQYTKAEQPVLGPPGDLRIYPIIADGTTYEGKINSASSLSQSEISRLANYANTSVAEFPPASTVKVYVNGQWVTQAASDPVKYHAGAYATDSYFKQILDGYISNMGPHIQRKLQTTEWEFAPAPMASHMEANGDPFFGQVVVRGVLKVRYSSSNNPLHLDPGVWYQGDVEMGMETTAFFTNSLQDRQWRTILMSLVVLGNWGKT